ncbi:hypothetical protein [Phenylobacterium sp.]|uniref:hypothetical protein n=1 Tax=Phenylobacterium sp. TaxID=1871053 RepID=UPI00391A4DE4
MTGADLFTWRDEVEAREAAQAAEAAREAAARAARRAPHGQVHARQQRLAEATTAALRAELELARIRRELGAR